MSGPEKTIETPLTGLPGDYLVTTSRSLQQSLCVTSSSTSPRQVLRLRRIDHVGKLRLYGQFFATLLPNVIDPEKYLQCGVICK